LGEVEEAHAIFEEFAVGFCVGSLLLGDLDQFLVRLCHEFVIQVGLDNAVAAALVVSATALDPTRSWEFRASPMHFVSVHCSVSASFRVRWIAAMALSYSAAATSTHIHSLARARVALAGEIAVRIVFLANLVNAGCLSTQNQHPLPPGP
jgi:hypothetical protein